MSVIAVKREGGKVSLAADSAILLDNNNIVRNEASLGFSKVQKIGDIVVGGVGRIDESHFLFEWLRTERPVHYYVNVQALYKLLREFAAAKDRAGGDSSIRNNYIFAAPTVACIAHRNSVVEVRDYAAIGAGQQFALAALHLGHTVEEAVQVAIDLNPDCLGPVNVYL